MVNEIKSSFLKRGSVYLADLGDITAKSGSLQVGKRPVILVSNDLNNFHSSMITVIPLTSSKFKKNLPTHVEINTTNSKIEKDSIALGEQIMVIPKNYIIKDAPLFTLSEDLLKKVDVAMMIQLGILSARNVMTVSA